MVGYQLLTQLDNSCHSYLDLCMDHVRLEPIFHNKPLKCWTATYARLKYRLSLNLSSSAFGPVWLSLAHFGSLITFLWLSLCLFIALHVC